MWVILKWLNFAKASLNVKAILAFFKWIARYFIRCCHGSRIRESKKNLKYFSEYVTV